jgi:hypothetical protein
MPLEIRPIHPVFAAEVTGNDCTDYGTIMGRTIPEAWMFLRDRTEFATQPRFVCSHE